MVQAFHLPKNPHVTLPYAPPPRELSDKLEELATSDAPAEFIASEFVMMDIDSDTEEVPQQAPHAYGPYCIPKTMQEMAEEHAATRRQQLGGNIDDNLDGVNDGEDTSPQAARPTGMSKKQTTVKVTLPSRASASASTSNNLSSNRSKKVKTNRKSSTSNLKRKRKNSRKKVEEESDSANLTLTDEEAQEDDKDQQYKRARVRTAVKAKPTPVAITPSTRTLRPRVSKTTTQTEEDGDD